MSIRVTCPGCLKKFQVSDQFAGQKGPCPSCKKEITIPDPEKDKVVIHDTAAGPKDSQGQSILKPIFRKEATISKGQIITISVAVVAYLVGALIVRNSAEGAPGLWILALGALLIGPPMALAGYFFLKEDELGSFAGQELWLRVGVAGALFALLWFAPMVTVWAFHGGATISLVIAVAVMFGIGGAVAMGAFDFDFLNGAILYGLYFGATVLMRVIVGISALPAMGAA